MRFQRLASYFSQLESTASRLEITRILARLFKEAECEEIGKICYLSLGRLAPLYETIEFNLAEKMMLKVLAQSFGEKKEEIKKKYKQVGDLGELAYRIKTQQTKRINNRSKISISYVYGKLLEIAGESGEGSVERKINRMMALLSEMDALSIKYVVRITLGKLRLGFSDMTIMDALSWLLVGDKSKRQEIEAAYQVRVDVGQIARLVKKKGIFGLKDVSVQVGTPVMPALCQRLPNVEEMIEKMCPSGTEQVAVEPKYDGARLQIHFSKKKKWQLKEDQLAFDFQPAGFVRTFTRNLENNTHMFPDLVRAIFKETKVSEAILDCEAVGYDPRSGKLLPFQETMKRKRKYEITKTAQSVPLRFYCFDIIYKDGKDLLKMPFAQRREVLTRIVSASGKTITISPQIVTCNPGEIRSYHDEQIRKGLEGVVVKKWDAPYDPGRRGYTWVKFKAEKGKKGAGLADTLDCLVMGCYRGKGKRTRFGIGAFLVGIRNKDIYQTVSKIGTGLSDEQWQEMYRRCEEAKTDKKPTEYQVPKELIPDSWCYPEIVVEIEADNITKSPLHAAKYALRFPRLVRFRDDKSPDQVTTIKETENLNKLQR
ncbi:MAG TPA: ATP-dependent DNA ligase [Candidatus Bathyarchaeia archaeon]|nr:ATP-dependent DNA ligase [Candidatus Bathyarchaeia archaeon]